MGLGSPTYTTRRSVAPKAPYATHLWCVLSFLHLESACVRCTAPAVLSVSFPLSLHAFVAPRMRSLFYVSIGMWRVGFSNSDGLAVRSFRSCAHDVHSAGDRVSDARMSSSRSFPAIPLIALMPVSYACGASFVQHLLHKVECIRSPTATGGERFELPIVPLT